MNSGPSNLNHKQNKSTGLLIIGAGPFGLALSAFAKRSGIEHMIVGKPMEFWKLNMPGGMFLRSTCDWQLDAANEFTIDRYLETIPSACKDMEPLSRDLYLAYTNWFIEQNRLDILPVYITQLHYIADHNYQAHCDDGRIISAKAVVVATGFKYFKHFPQNITGLLPGNSYYHTCDLVNFEPLRNKRVLIVGGRQSAFEWAALIQEAGAKMIHIIHRHASPEFKTADWSWVGGLVGKLGTDPGWFRNLSREEKENIVKKLWTEGRLKIEPWLESRVLKDNVKIMPFTQVAGCSIGPEQELNIRLDNGDSLVVDRVILATGYKVNTSNLPFFANGNILPLLDIENDFPVLDEHFQTNLPGLFITSMPAIQDFGPYFGFTISARVSARIIVNRLSGAVNTAGTSVIIPADPG